MARTLNEIAADLDSLAVRDFDLWNEDANGMERLNDLTEELYQLNLPEPAANLMLRFMERLNGSDIGSPGPLVHTLEKLAGYERQLFESVERKPTPVNVWMISRILNVTAEVEKRKPLIALLRQVMSHPLASEETRKDAEDFLKYQGEA